MSIVKTEILNKNQVSITQVHLTVDKEDNIIPLIESVFQKLQDGKISYDQYTRYEMTDLGFDPNKESDIKKYIEFMENLTYLESSNILNDNDNEE